MGEHIEASTVRHADHDFVGTVAGTKVHQLVNHRHCHVEALDRELLLAKISLVHEALESVNLRQATKQSNRLVLVERLAEAA